MKTLPPILNSRKNEDELLPISKDYPAIGHDNKNIPKMRENLKFAEFMKEQGFAASFSLNSFLKEDKGKMFVTLSDYRAEINTVINRVPVSIKYDADYNPKSLLSTFDSRVDMYFQLKQKLDEVSCEIELVEAKLRRFKQQNKCLSKAVFVTERAFAFSLSLTKARFASQLVSFNRSSKRYRIVLVFIESKLYMYPASIEKEHSFIFDSEIFTTYANVIEMMDVAEKKAVKTMISPHYPVLDNTVKPIQEAAEEAKEEEEDDCDDF